MILLYFVVVYLFLIHLLMSHVNTQKVFYKDYINSNYMFECKNYCNLLEIRPTNYSFEVQLEGLDNNFV